MLWRHMGTVRGVAVPGRNRGVEGVGLSALCALQCLLGWGGGENVTLRLCTGELRCASWRCEGLGRRLVIHQPGLLLMVLDNFRGTT